MTPTTETLLCTSLGFDIETASPVQRARCRIGDGLPLEELQADPDVAQMVGGTEALERLPSERGVAPDTFVDASSIRSCKTMMAVCRSARAVFAVDVSSVRIGEVPRIPIWSLKLSRARVAFRMLRALFRRDALAPLVLSETAESITVRHPSGVPIEIVCVAGGRTAQDFVGDWLAGVIADEAPRMLGRDDGVVNLSDVLTAVQGRMLPGAQVQLIGTPWSPNGPVYDLVQEHFAKPSERVVVLRSTGPMNWPAHFTPERCAEMEQSDPVAYSTSVMGEFADPETGLLSGPAVRAAIRESPLELPINRHSETRYGAAVDVGKGRWTLVVIERNDDVEGTYKYRVACAAEFMASDPDRAWADVADVCHRYEIKYVGVDQYAASESKAIASRYGITLEESPWGPQNKLDAFLNLATILHSGRLELAPVHQLRRDLLAVKKRTTATGYTIFLPTTSDGRHCDYGPALAAAVRDAAGQSVNYYNVPDLFPPGHAYLAL